MRGCTDCPLPMLSLTQRCSSASGLSTPVSRQTYGAPRVHADLRAGGEKHGRKRIARLMRNAGLVGACHRRGGPTTTRRDSEVRPAPDLVDRNFTASKPNQLWIADITLPADCGGVPVSGCRAGCLEPQGRRLVDGEPSASRAGAGRAGDGVGQRRPHNVIHHSDQGSQPGFNQSLQRSCGSTAGARQTPRQVSSSQGFCETWC